MRTLIVYLNAERVGVLGQDDSGKIQFSYDKHWLDKPGTDPLSCSLPLESTVFIGKKARAFFAGILPEEGPRKQIAKILGISESNDFSMLAEIGGECAGAVSLLPEHATLAVSGVSQCRELSELELFQIIEELPRRPLLVGRDGLRLSLAGAQDKLPVVVLDDGIGLPLGGTPSTHILKPEPVRFPGLALNELFCMNLARAVGLRVPDVEYRLIQGKPCVLVQRYDRTVGADNRPCRIHQEDFCQAMGFPPERKYQAEGGPMLSDCIALLREWSTLPARDIPDFVSSIIFNVLIGNADAHGKNYAMLYAGGDRRLAPFYDLVSTLAWPELTKRPAMKIGPCESINVFAVADWEKLASRAGLGWPMVRERIITLSYAVQQALNAIPKQTSLCNHKMTEHLSRMIGERSQRMINAFSK